MTNEYAEELVYQFRETQSSIVFDELWKGTYLLADPYKYYDPTGARTSDDFLQITRIALIKAIRTYKSESKSTPLSWIRQVMHTALIREMRKCTSGGYETKISWDGNSDDSKHHSYSSIETLVYEQLARNELYQRSSQQWSEDLFWTIIADVMNRIEGNILLEKAFSLKLAFPHIQRKTIAKVLKVTRPTLSNYFSQIRNHIQLATEQYATS